MKKNAYLCPTVNIDRDIVGMTFRSYCYLFRKSAKFRELSYNSALHRVWVVVSVKGFAEPAENTAAPHLFIRISMQPRETAIQMMHNRVVNDLLELAKPYEHLRQASPEIWKSKVLTEGQQFLKALRKHLPFQRFCLLYDVNQEEFILGVIRSIFLYYSGIA